MGAEPTTLEMTVLYRLIFGERGAAGSGDDENTRGERAPYRERDLTSRFHHGSFP